MPVIHKMPLQIDTTVPFVVINLSTEAIPLSKCEDLDFLEPTDTEICKVMTSIALEPLTFEVTAEHPKNPLPYKEGQFICVPADISVHRKVDLQDAEVSENI